VLEAAAPRRLAGISEAARVLGVNKGTLSRQVTKGLIRDHAGPGQTPLIDLDTVEAELAQNGDPTKRRAQGQTVPAAKGLAASKAAAAEIDTERKRLALAKDLRTVLDRGEVEAAFEDMARKVRQAFERSRAAFCAKAAGLDPNALLRELEAREALIFDGLTEAFEQEAGLERAVPG
jgi:hypothetical protein